MIVNDNINYLLIDIEPMSIFESIDVRSVTSKPEFPSEEFGDFMELLAKLNLSDACGSDILKFSKKIYRDDVNLPTSVGMCQSFGPDLRTWSEGPGPASPVLR